MSYESIILGESSLRYYWELGETTGTSAADSKDSDTGTYTGTGWTLNQGGIAGSTNGAASSDGTSGTYVNTSTGPINFAHATVECWVYLPSLPATNHRFIPVQFADSGNHSNVYEKAFAVRWDGKIEWYIYDGTINTVTSSGSISTGNWHHLVGTCDGTTTKLYIDGVPDGSALSGNSYASYATPPTIIIGGIVDSSGGFGSGSIDYYAGRIGHVSIYDSVLSPTAIAVHHTVGMGGAPPPSTSMITGAFVTPHGMIMVQVGKRSDGTPQLLTSYPSDPPTITVSGPGGGTVTPGTVPVGTSPGLLTYVLVPIPPSLMVAAMAGGTITISYPDAVLYTSDGPIDAQTVVATSWVGGSIPAMDPTNLPFTPRSGRTMKVRQNIEDPNASALCWYLNLRMGIRQYPDRGVNYGNTVPAALDSNGWPVAGPPTSRANIWTIPSNIPGIYTWSWTSITKDYVFVPKCVDDDAVNGPVTHTIVGDVITASRSITRTSGSILGQLWLHLQKPVGGLSDFDAVGGWIIGTYPVDVTTLEIYRPMVPDRPEFDFDPSNPTACSTYPFDPIVVDMISNRLAATGIRLLDPWLINYSSMGVPADYSYPGQFSYADGLGRSKAITSIAPYTPDAGMAPPSSNLMRGVPVKIGFGSAHPFYEGSGGGQIIGIGGTAASTWGPNGNGTFPCTGGYINDGGPNQGQPYGSPGVASPSRINVHTVPGDPTSIACYFDGTWQVYGQTLSGTYSISDDVVVGTLVCVGPPIADAALLAKLCNCDLRYNSTVCVTDAAIAAHAAEILAVNPTGTVTVAFGNECWNVITPINYYSGSAAHGAYRSGLSGPQLMVAQATRLVSGFISAGFPAAQLHAAVETQMMYTAIYQQSAEYEQANPIPLPRSRVTFDGASYIWSHPSITGDSGIDGLLATFYDYIESTYTDVVAGMIRSQWMFDEISLLSIDRANTYDSLLTSYEGIRSSIYGSDPSGWHGWGTYEGNMEFGGGMSADRSRGGLMENRSWRWARSPAAVSFMNRYLNSFDYHGYKYSTVFYSEGPANSIGVSGGLANYGTLDTSLQLPGKGDGSDGLFDNRTSWYDTGQLVSPRALAIQEWNGFIPPNTVALPVVDVSISSTTIGHATSGVSVSIPAVVVQVHATSPGSSASTTSMSLPIVTVGIAAAGLSSPPSPFADTLSTVLLYL